MEKTEEPMKERRALEGVQLPRVSAYISGNVQLPVLQLIYTTLKVT